ncbi:MAG: LysR family transcriptional regulator [Clostridiales Family XIII bacterium]|nr:LysR family transcriptional regulator [Clostridiales Family XIII bacterium]
MFQDNKIKAFLTLAETLSYTKTAKQMYMSQQAVSRCVAALENELDTQLFIRTTRSVGLTMSGRLYYNLYNDLSRQYDERTDQIRIKTEGENAERIRIGIQSFLDPSPLVDVVEGMHKMQPELQIQVTCLTPSLLLEEFQRNTVDAVILLDRFLPESFSAAKKELDSAPLYLMVSRFNKNATDSASYQDFMSLPFISDSLDGEDSLAHRARMEHDIDRWGLSPETIIWAYDLGAAVTYAELGYGVIIDSNRSRITAGRNLKIYDTGRTESIYIIHKENGLNDTAIKLLIKKLIKSYRAAAE